MVRLLLLLVLLTQPPINGKGVAGSISEGQAADLGAGWWHRWTLLKPGDNELGYSWFKGFWTLDIGSDFYGDWARLEQNIRECRHGIIGFGDEWVLQNWPMAKQIAELRRFIGLRDSINPQCRIAFGGVLAWHPQTAQRGAGPQWVREFTNAYYNQYGCLPPIEAVVMDSYYWPWFRRDWQADTGAMVDAIREVYGYDVEIWAREVGCLLDHECALESVDKLGDITPMLDRWAFFISDGNGEGWGHTSLYDGGELTDLGEAYQDWQPPETWRVFVPEMRRQ